MTTDSNVEKLVVYALTNLQPTEMTNHFDIPIYTIGVTTDGKPYRKYVDIDDILFSKTEIELKEMILRLS
ncbi:MAG: hypothetical protein DRG78_00295 [Epsilonproteobacteria bacterium]|nr:MAG: hypothetical protein DRG78_00295 [Campylobacterota bacterium]